MLGVVEEVEVSVVVSVAEVVTGSSGVVAVGVMESSGVDVSGEIVGGLVESVEGSGVEEVGVVVSAPVLLTTLPVLLF